MNTPNTNPSEQERELEQRLADLQKRLPKHSEAPSCPPFREVRHDGASSVPVSMMSELEELEEALAAVRRQTRQATEQNHNKAEIASYARNDTPLAAQEV